MRELLLAPVAVIATACSTTEFKVPMEASPLAKIAEQAATADGWSVVEQTETTLRLSEPWPVHSVFSLGYTAFHADLRYDAPNLWSTLYLQTNGLFTLYFSQKIDCDDGMYGGMLKPRMREAARRVLDWGQVPEGERPPSLRN